MGTRPLAEAAGIAWRGGLSRPASRTVAEEMAVAITYDGSTHAVMMASPADLEDFALGFTLTEGIVDHPDQVLSIETVELEIGIELRMALAGDRSKELSARRRSMAGPVGCGLCGIEGLEAAMRPLRRVESAARFDADAVLAAVAALDRLQPLNGSTHAVHGAAFWQGGAPAPLREDVGRHNALDKLVGALAKAGIEAGRGAVLLTSRLSVELVQKTAVLGAPLLVGLSAPTALAIRTAEEAGITLVAVARRDGFEVFTHSGRIAFDAAAAGADIHAA